MTNRQRCLPNHLDCLTLYSVQTRLLLRRWHPATRLYKRPHLGLNLEEVSPTRPLPKWLTSGAQCGEQLLNSTNRRRELKIDDLLFVFRLPPAARALRDSACPSFLTSLDRTIQAVTLLVLFSGMRMTDGHLYPELYINITCIAWGTYPLSEMECGVTGRRTVLMPSCGFWREHWWVSLQFPIGKGSLGNVLIVTYTIVDHL